MSEVLSVAAVNASTPTQIEPYSARGPGLIIFSAPELRNVPNITAVDGVETRVGRLGFLSNPFTGTSAAAPHVAAIAALVIERNPTLTSEEIRTLLTSTAVDESAPGFEFAFGYGLVDAFAAVQAVPPVSPSIALAAAVLPGSRAVQVGRTATAFAAIAAGGSGTATNCGIALATSVPGAFGYQTTDPTTNALTGQPNTPATIARR
jgi:subtilisin family serine protease